MIWWILVAFLVLRIGIAALQIRSFRKEVKAFLPTIFALPTGMVHESGKINGWINYEHHRAPSTDEVEKCAAIYLSLLKKKLIEPQDFTSQADLVCVISNKLG